MLAIGPLGIGVAIGLVLGLLGGGGAILAVPGLVYILGVEPHAAIAASLAIVAVGALTGLLVHARQGRVAWAMAIQLGLTGVVGSIAGAWLGQLVPGERLLALLGLFMLLAAWLMVRRPRMDGDRATAAALAGAADGPGPGLAHRFLWGRRRLPDRAGPDARPGAADSPGHRYVAGRHHHERAGRRRWLPWRRHRRLAA